MCSRRASQCTIQFSRQRGTGIWVSGKETYVCRNPHSCPTRKVGSIRLTIFSTTVEYHRVRCFIKIILSSRLILLLASSALFYKRRPQLFCSFCEVKISTYRAEVSRVHHKSIPCFLKTRSSPALHSLKIPLSHFSLKWILARVRTIMAPVDHFLLYCKLSKHFR